MICSVVSVGPEWVPGELARAGVRPGHLTFESVVECLICSVVSVGARMGARRESQGWGEARARTWERISDTTWWDRQSLQVEVQLLPQVIKLLLLQ